MYNLTRYLVAGVVLSLALQGGVALAQEEELKAVELAESVTLEDLEVQDLGLFSTDADKSQLEGTMQGHILVPAELIGLYSRN